MRVDEGKSARRRIKLRSGWRVYPRATVRARVFACGQSMTWVRMRLRARVTGTFLMFATQDRHESDTISHPSLLAQPPCTTVTPGPGGVPAVRLGTTPSSLSGVGAPVQPVQAPQTHTDACINTHVRTHRHSRPYTPLIHPGSPCTHRWQRTTARGGARPPAAQSQCPRHTATGDPAAAPTTASPWPAQECAWYVRQSRYGTTVTSSNHDVV